MNGNNKNNTAHYKGRKSFFSGKTKHILILLPAILLLTGILITSLAASQATALPASNGNMPLYANTVSTLGGSSSGGLSLNGNLTTVGSTSLLNGNLTLTNAQQVILGSPLIQTGTLNITADKIEIGKPSNESDTIIMSGTVSNPSIIDQFGNIFMGNQSEAREIVLNITSFYQYVNSSGPGYIGDWGQSQNDLPVNSMVAINVSQGTLYSYSLTLGVIPTNISIDSTNFHIDIAGAFIKDIDLGPYGGIANISWLKADGQFDNVGGLNVTPFIGDIVPSVSMYWNDPIVFEAWGPWFAVGDATSGAGGVISMTDTYIQMRSNDTIYFEFLNTSTDDAGLKITPSTNYLKAVMNVKTLEQNINVLGSTYIKNGSMSMIGNTTLPQQEIINGILDYEGEMLLENGDMIIQGTFGIGGGSLIKSPVSISGSLNIDNIMTGTGDIVVSDGYMQIVGDTRISNGEISVLNGDVVMNSSGTYIGSATSITGDIAVSSIVTNAGLLKMSGIFTFLIPMSITGSMVTAGITGMGSLGAINGIMTVTGNIIMSGLTTIIGDNNIIGSMTVTPAGVWVNGLVGLMGVVQTSNTPAISSETILEINVGSLMGLPIPHISVLVNPATLLVLGVLGIGTVYVVIRTVYSAIKERRTLGARIRAIGEKLSNSGKRLIGLLRGK